MESRSIVFFSQRKGYKSVSTLIQRDDINDDLRNTLWNILLVFFRGEKDFYDSAVGESGLEKYSLVLWLNYFKKPIDSRPNSSSRTFDYIRDYFFTCPWYEVYDFVEFSLNYFNSDILANYVNAAFDRELSAYRFVNNILTDITEETEIQMLNGALNNNEFPGVKEHLNRALELLSDRKKPDYRNSIKESISAVECLARIICHDSTATLGDALKKIKQKSVVHPALIEAFNKLYGYTSDEGGIRHAMLDEPNISSADAKFFLLSCTSFINYLKSKL